MLLALGRHVVEEASSKKGLKVLHWAESHPCDRLCGRTIDDPEGDLEQRAAMRCGLVGFHPSRWAGDSAMAEAWLQRIAMQPDEPERPTLEDGCPGAAYRSRFAASLRPYLRRRGRDDPRRDVNPLLGPDTDPFILDCVRLYEAYEDRAYDRMNERALG